MALVLAAWAVDGRGSGDEVLRGVRLAGEDVGGLRGRQLDAAVADVADRLESGEVRVETPEGDLTLDAAEVGLEVDEAATRRAVLDAGRGGSFPSRVWGWLEGFWGARTVDVVATGDAEEAAGVLAERDPTEREEPREPAVEWDARDSRLEVVPGRPGRGLVPRRVVDALPGAAAGGRSPVVVETEPGPVPPRLRDRAAERLLAATEAATATPLPVRAGQLEAELPPEAVRPWLRSRRSGGRLVLALDVERARSELPRLLPGAGTPGRDATLAVQGSGVVVIPDAPGTTCCDPGAVGLVLDAVRRPEAPRPVVLPLAPAPAERTADEVAALGVVEPVASFTTRHAAGESRVTNIHRIADLLRGTLIEPGGRFSVNETIGPRTTAKGFVAGGVIQDGVFTESVGGGISQFATTLFNAAFFAGLDFEEYQSHSIYISRYPYGREATLSYPAPDLVIENPTPHGVLLWPTYDASSITVTLWSTRSVAVQETGRTEEQRGNCTRVTTSRSRTFLATGRTEVDSVSATYRPGEGVDC